MVKKTGKKLINKAHDLVFNNIHGRHLVFNACWEDPRIDRQLLELDRDSKVVMITSAGCNALDYLLDSPAEIHAVDVNPRQNALLHLKLALIEQIDFDDFFAMFGLGAHQAYRQLYKVVMSYLPPYARAFWKDKIYYFDRSHLKKSFYYHGTSGDIAWLTRQYFRRIGKDIRDHFCDLLEASSLEEQQQIYSRIEPKLWNAFVCWLVKEPVVLAMLGTPRPQLQLAAKQHPEGMSGYVRSNLKRVATEVPMKDNYFWRIFLTGSYTQTCCPNYLKEENFNLLRASTGKIRTYTCTLTEFLKRYPGPYTHFILLDHQDWLAWHDPDALREEWQYLLNNSQPGSKILMRSASAEVNFLPQEAQSALRFFSEETASLHRQDRIGTYCSLHLAEVV